MNGKEIVITGMGVVSPIANELNLFWDGIKSYILYNSNVIIRQISPVGRE